MVQIPQNNDQNVNISYHGAQTVHSYFQLNKKKINERKQLKNHLISLFQ